VRRLLVLFLISSVGAFAQDTGGDDSVVMVGASDPKMVAAIKKARATLDDFLQVAANPPPGASGFKLKVAVRYPGGAEHMWVTPFVVTSTGFQGTLSNVPAKVQSMKIGQVFQFTRGEVSDWGYTLNGRQIGSFTVCALFVSMPRDKADFYRKNYGFEC